ncbi:MAG: CBS domain-containing protein [Acidimicrobiia bacterium]|nr:CBS domain-containing protein [Acidimicrobiia bacterium]
MNVSEILDRKGNRVVTVAPEDSVRTVVATLAERGFGALVVSSDGSTIDGIVSERDIVRQLGREGERVLDQAVGGIMTTPVMTCQPGDDVQGLMSRMTEHRIRHLPVSTDGALSGMISIGDVVKWRVTELERDMGHLENYIKQGW